MTGRSGRSGQKVLQRVRRQCLSLPETSEAASWGHPNFRAGKRMFVAFEWIGGRPSIAFRLSPTDVDLLLRRKCFFVTPYGQGRWVSLWGIAKSIKRWCVAWSSEAIEWSP